MSDYLKSHCGLAMRWLSVCEELKLQQSSTNGFFIVAVWKAFKQIHLQLLGEVHNNSRRSWFLFSLRCLFLYDYECFSLSHWLLKTNGVSVRAPGAGAVGGDAAETPAVCCVPPGCACVPPTGLCVDAAVWPQLADRPRLGGWKKSLIPTAL